MWYDSISKDSDVVISSRVRFARNIAGFKFPHMLNAKQKVEIIKLVEKSIDRSNYKLIKMKDIEKNDRFSLVEKRLISKELIDDESSAIIINNDYTLVTMLNEEDHLRIQSFQAGFNIEQAYDNLKEFTDKLNEKIDFSINKKYGYLTSCPTNVGSGMRVSVMLHLPGLAKIGLLDKIIDQALNIGFVVRGLYGENSKSIGNVYQISNQKTLGITDSDIIYNVKAIISVIIEQERKAREILLKESIDFKDCIYRAYGILKYTRMISNEEALELLSKVRLGVSTNLITDISLKKIQELMINVEPYSLKLMLREEFDDEEQNEKRSNYIRREIG